LLDWNDEIAVDRPFFQELRFVSLRIVKIRIKLLIANFLILYFLSTRGR
jgi:hypothetical protein